MSARPDADRVYAPYRFCEGGGVRLPSATRLVRSIKEECLDRLIPLGERHFRRALAEGTWSTTTASAIIKASGMT